MDKLRISIEELNGELFQLQDAIAALDPTAYNYEMMVEHIEDCINSVVEDIELCNSQYIY